MDIKNLEKETESKLKQLKAKYDALDDKQHQAREKTGEGRDHPEVAKIYIEMDEVTIEMDKLRLALAKAKLDDAKKSKASSGVIRQHQVGVEHWEKAIKGRSEDIAKQKAKLSKKHESCTFGNLVERKNKLNESLLSNREKDTFRMIKSVLTTSGRYNFAVYNPITNSTTYFKTEKEANEEKDSLQDKSKTTNFMVLNKNSPILRENFNEENEVVASKDVKRIWSDAYRKKMNELRTKIKVFSGINGPEAVEEVIKTITKDAPILMKYYQDKMKEYQNKHEQMYKEYSRKFIEAEQITKQSKFFETRKDIPHVETWLKDWIDLIIN